MGEQVAYRLHSMSLIWVSSSSWWVSMKSFSAFWMDEIHISDGRDGNSFTFDSSYLKQLSAAAHRRTQTRELGVLVRDLVLHAPHTLRHSRLTNSRGISDVQICMYPTIILLLKRNRTISFASSSSCLSLA